MGVKLQPLLLMIGRIGLQFIIRQQQLLALRLHEFTAQTDVADLGAFFRPAEVVRDEDGEVGDGGEASGLKAILQNGIGIHIEVELLICFRAPAVIEGHEGSVFEEAGRARVTSAFFASDDDALQFDESSEGDVEEQLLWKKTSGLNYRSELCFAADYQVKHQSIRCRKTITADV